MAARRTLLRVIYAGVCGYLFIMGYYIYGLNQRQEPLGQVVIVDVKPPVRSVLDTAIAHAPAMLREVSKENAKRQAHSTTTTTNQPSTVAMRKFNSTVELDLSLFHLYPLDVNLTETVSRIRRGLKAGVEPLNSHPYRYVTKVVCEPDESVFVVLLIKSIPGKGRDRRQAIRETWGNATVVGGQSVKRIFVLGKVSGGGDAAEQTQASIRREQDTYNDIVQEDFEERYNHTSIKTTASFRWAVNHCGHARYMAFVDDDVLVNPRNLVNLLQTDVVKKTPRLYMGLVNRYDRPYRNAKSKWYLPIDVYPFKRYPLFMPAGTMIMNMAFARDYVIGWQYVRHLPFDDVFIGLVAKKLGVGPIHTDLVFHPGKVHAPLSLDKNRDFVTSLSEHSPKSLRAHWAKMTALQLV